MVYSLLIRIEFIKQKYNNELDVQKKKRKIKSETSTTFLDKI